MNKFREELQHISHDVKESLEAIVVVPLLRGFSHVVASFAAGASALVLALQAVGVTQLVAGLIYGSGLTLALSTSAIYHRGGWKPRAKRLWQRLDHAMIFVLVGASYTPILLVGLDGWWRVVSMIAVWSMAALGITMRFSVKEMPRWVLVSSYMSIGWVALALLPKLWFALDTTTFVLLLAGGLLYSMGAAVFLFKRPNPIPHIFGFHEVFHVFVILAATCHYFAVWPLIAS